ncbi:hypothetical protein PYK79_48400 [Streptomyces sp. ID05-04B]|uniref:hypothetical protein n=1 Tax=Streptomyces sp. ID05-04B TaxID=3028661 RepID=UPI0029C1BC02|nr:hypothetical protein [Streptomyces sp. ID05-04B]MDX5569525.1 hypothetical protein [Streptomyces sp. ID05-04B]
MTPADEIREAAATLHKLTADATPGPWLRPLNTRYKATVTGPLPEGERGSWIGGVDPETGERERCTIAMVPTWSNGRHSRQRGGRDLEYIAAMDPGVGAALAELLDTAAEYVADDSPTHPTHVVHALAVARAINGGQP